MKTSGCLVLFIILLFIFVGVYIAAHAYRYSGCVFTPDIFAWPRSCF